MLLERHQLQVPVELLRLLHVVPTYLPAVRYGGPIQTVHALCRALAARGHDVHVFTTNVDGSGDSAVPLLRPVDMDGVKVTYFPSRTLRRLYWSPPMKRAMLAQGASFDLFHLHALYLWPTWAGAGCARACGRPYVVSPRGMLVPELIKRKNRWVKTAWLSLIDRGNVERASAVHATSDVEASHLPYFGWNLPTVEMIPHGVDDPPIESGGKVSPDVSAALDGAPIVLALGRISWEKGLDRLIAALPHVPNVKVVIAGGDAGGQAALLAEQAKKLRVESRVVIVARHVDGADKEALFGAAHAFAMTSLSENFGLAALEAMRRGVPVLATTGVGMSEIVGAARAGVVVNPDPAEIAKGLARLLSDEAARREMGQRGRQHVVAHYSWPAIAGRMEQLYARVLAKRTSSAKS